MSNYYVSNCCGAEVSEIDIESNTGRCLDCKEMCELEVVIDNKYMNNKPTKEIPKDELDKYTERAVEEPTKECNHEWVEETTNCLRCGESRITTTYEQPTLSTILQEADRELIEFFSAEDFTSDKYLKLIDFLNSNITKAYEAGREENKRFLGLSEDEYTHIYDRGVRHGIKLGMAQAKEEFISDYAHGFQEGMIAERNNFKLKLEKEKQLGKIAICEIANWAAFNWSRCKFLQIKRRKLLENIILEAYKDLTR